MTAIGLDEAGASRSSSPVESLVNLSARLDAGPNKNRRKHACKRSVTKGALAFTGHLGRNRVSFQGVISRSKKLRLGSYSLVITASVAGLTSAPARLGFTIVK